MNVVPDYDSPARLLIVDDHVLVRAGLRIMLASEPDLEVIGEAENGRRAVEMCRALNPDLVLMDVRMPEMDGLEATRTIKMSHPETSVLIVTTHQDQDYLLDAVRAGAAGYVLKEAPKHELFDTVRRVMSGESTLDQGLAMRLLRHLSGKKSGCEEAIPDPDGKRSRKTYPEPSTGSLSDREIEVLRLISAGKTNREISCTLMISLSSVNTYVQRLIAKLGVSDRTQAAVRAIEMGILIDKR